MAESKFTDEVRARRTELNMSFRELGERVAHAMGREQPFTASAAQDWEKTVPRPEIVFGLETALGVPPGGLSRILGYQPIIDEPETTRAMIERDPDLDESAREVLLGAYDTAVKHPRRR